MGQLWVSRYVGGRRMRIRSITFKDKPTNFQLSQTLEMVFNNWPVGKYRRPCRITKIWVGKVVMGYHFHYRSIKLNDGK